MLLVRSSAQNWVFTKRPPRDFARRPIPSRPNRLQGRDIGPSPNPNRGSADHELIADKDVIGDTWHIRRSPRYATKLPLWRGSSTSVGSQTASVNGRRAEAGPK